MTTPTPDPDDLIIDQSTWPAHLRDDAPSQRCSRCGRCTWSIEEFGKACRMPQLNGMTCGGRLGDSS